MPEWQPFHEPIRRTLTRTVAIALMAGAVLASWWGGLARWPAASAVMLWASLGGHYVELAFLTGVRRRLPRSTVVMVAARLAVWFLAGVVLGVGMWATAVALGAARGSRPAWWAAGLAFVALELVVHAVLQARGRPSFFNGRG
jgi:hypothetical protein